MAGTKRRNKHKDFRLDGAKIKHAQRFVKSGSRTETLKPALDALIAEHGRSRLARKANERFLKSGIEITDVYGKLA